MNAHPNTTTSQVSEIIEDWVAAYKREAISEDGDPDAFVDRIRALAEEADPETDTHRALAGFLELLELEEA